MFKIIIGVIIVTFAVIAAFGALSGNMGGNVVESDNLSTVEEGMIEVTITGEITAPGSYVISEDSVLGDLIEAADEVTSNADSRCYYLDYELVGGMEFYIAPLKDDEDVCTTEEIAKVNINKDDKATLMEIGAIGTTLASAIINYREETGSFRSLEEIKNVTGIGEATYEKVKDYITLKDWNE